VTIQDVGSVGELIAAIATIATLIYLAAQIRQNTSTVATSTYNSVFDGFNQMNLPVASDPELARILHAGQYDPTSLDENEQIRFFLLMRSVSNHYLKLLRLRERGALSGGRMGTTRVRSRRSTELPEGSYFGRRI
jgi:hypothetical protein